MNPSCEICGKEPNRIVRLNDNYRAYLCSNCDFLFTDTEHSNEARNKVNRDFYKLEDRVLTYYLRKKEFQRRYEKVFELIVKKIADGRIKNVLEIGSNIGFFANIIKQKGIAVETVEINKELREYQSTIYGINSLYSIEDLRNKKFDVIILMDVLEHIPQPIKYLQKLTDYLTKNGVIFLQFPNKNSLLAKVAGRKWQWWSAPDHLYHFSEKSILKVAEKAGLQVHYLRKVSLLLDDLLNLPYLGRFFKGFLVINYFRPVNPFINFNNGSILQVILKKTG